MASYEYSRRCRLKLLFRHLLSCVLRLFGLTNLSLSNEIHLIKFAVCKQGTALPLSANKAAREVQEASARALHSLTREAEAEEAACAGSGCCVRLLQRQHASGGAAAEEIAAAVCSADCFYRRDSEGRRSDCSEGARE